LPPLNQERRDALTDAAIEILAESGTHGLSHRAVDERAEVPAGTTSNYFRSRDALLEAAAQRVVQLHFRWLADIREQHAGELNRERLIEILAGVVDESINPLRHRYLAMFHLALESTHRPQLQQSLAQLSETSVELTRGVHLGPGIDPSHEDIVLLHAFYNGVLFAGLVIPNSLGDSAPSDLVRTMLSKVLPAEQARKTG
jgi:DNA-binding transcriptional regulator YbjK